MTPFNSKHFKVSLFIVLMTFVGHVEITAQVDNGFVPIQTLFQICRAPGPEGVLPESPFCADSETTIPIITDLDCQGTANLSFHMVDILDEVPDSKVTIMLPDEYPSFYFRWNEDSETEVIVGPFRELRYVAPDPNAEDSNHDYYAIDFKLTVNCQELCNPNGQNLQLPIEVLKLSGLVGAEDPTEVFENYPIEDFTGVGEIFSCTAFNETFNCCGMDGCTNLEYELNLCIDCQGCNSTENRSQDLDMQLHQEWSAYPNPFTEDINLSFRTNISQNIEIKFTNLNTQESLVVTEFIDKGRSQKRMDTSMLKSGIYIVTINNGINKYSKKIIKLGIGETRN